LPQHDSSLRGADITWSVSGGFFQTNFTDVGSGLNLSGRTTLDLRVDRADDPSLNTQPFTEFTAYLVNANDTLSAGYPIGWEPTLTGPAIGAGGAHSTLQTARIPLSVFSGANLASIRAVRLVFDRTPSGHIYVANIRASNSALVAGSALVAEATPGIPASAPVAPSDVTPGTGVRRTVQVVTTGNRVVSMRPTPDGAWVQIEVVTGGTKFSPRDARLELQMGGAKSLLSGSPNGDLSRVIFTMDRKAFDAVANGATMTARYVPTSDIEWSFGALDKSLLTP
jgi:hypothetical protein